MAKQPEKPKSTAKPASGGGSRSVARRQERESERRRRRLITGGIIAAVVIAAAVFIFAVVNAPAEAPIPEASAARYAGISQTRTENGFPRLGDPAVPVQVAIYSSFDCPHCREFHDEAIDPIVDRVREGKIAFTYVPLYGFGGITNGQGAAAASICAAEQSRFWEFHDALFEWQGIYGNQAFTNNRINSGVDALGMDHGAFNACVTSGRANTTLSAADTQRRNLLNFGGTPTITINGIVPLGTDQQPLQGAADIIARIDTEIERFAAIPQVTPEATIEPTAEVTDTVTPADEPTAEATEAATPEATVESTAEATVESTAEAPAAS